MKASFQDSFLQSYTLRGDKITCFPAQQWQHPRKQTKFTPPLLWNGWATTGEATMSMLNKNNCMAIRKQWQPLARFLLGMRSIRGFSLRYPETSLYSCLAFRKRFGIRYAWDMRPIRFTAVSAKLKKQKGAIRGLKRFAANWTVSAHRTAALSP
jgi:hypothetical protein